MPDPTRKHTPESLRDIWRRDAVDRTLEQIHSILARGLCHVDGLEKVQPEVLEMAKERLDAAGWKVTVVEGNPGRWVVVPDVKEN